MKQSNSILCGLILCASVGCSQAESRDSKDTGAEAYRKLSSHFSKKWNYKPFEYVKIRDTKSFTRSFHDSTEFWYVIECEPNDNANIGDLVKGACKSMTNNNLAVVEEEVFHTARTTMKDPEGWSAQDIRQPATRLEVKYRSLQSPNGFDAGLIFVFSNTDNRVFVARWTN